MTPATDVAGCGRRTNGRLRHLDPHLASGLVLAQAEEHGVADPAVGRPFRERHLGHELRRHPVHAAHARRIGERRALPLERVELRAERLQRRAVEAGSDLSAIAQRALRIVRAEQQRTESDARSAGLREPRDHELLALRAPHLEPGARAAGPVRRVDALRDDALDAARAGRVVELGPAADDVLAEANRRAF